MVRVLISGQSFCFCFVALSWDVGACGSESKNLAAVHALILAKLRGISGNSFLEANQASMLASSWLP